MDSQHRQLFGSPAPPQGPIPPNNSPVAGYLPTERVQPNVLRSALEAAAQNTHHRGTTGGSARPYQAQPRLRRTTAVSSLRSNRPRTFSQGRELYENNYNHQRGYGTQNNHEQHRRLVDQQNNTNRQAPHGFQNGYYADAEVADDFAYLQHSLYSAAQLISGQTAMPSNVVATLTSEIHDLSQLCIELRRKTRDNARVLQGEVNRLRHLISDQQRLVQNALAERDRACAERDRHEVEYVEALATQRGIEQKKVKEVEKKNEDTIKYLRRQIQFKNEQISAKRSLWMENHRDAGAKRKIDPFATPTATGTAKYNHLFETPTGLDVPDPHFYSGLPHEYWPYHHASGSKNRGARTHCNSPDLTPSILRAADAYSITSDEFESTAVIPFKTEDQIAEEFRKDFEETYGLVEQWVQSFASKVNDIEFDQKVSHDSSLWSFILGCTIGTLPDAHDRTIVLLRNPATRGFLVMRMIVQYIYLYIWKASAFCGADVKQGQKILYAEQQLRSKGLDPNARANLVAIQVHAMRRIVEDEGYLAWRSTTLSHHTAELRNMLGPLLDLGIERKDAGRGLGGIAVSAWDLSAKIFTSNFTFIWSFSECGARFVHPSVECVDPSEEETPMQLGIRQAKIKLAITPIITIRNDRLTTISVKDVCKGHVLILP